MSGLFGSHDKFFRQLLSSPEALADFLRNYLPESLARSIEPGSARLEKGSFVDKRLRDHFSDILCSVRLSNGNAAYFYALLEHKSFPDRWVAFQLLRYMVKIWERDFREFKQREGRSKEKRTSQYRLVPIIPVVVYHGKAKWKVSKSFAALFGVSAEFEPLVPDFQFLIADLSAYSDEEIKGAAILRAGLLVIKYIFSDELGRSSLYRPILKSHRRPALQLGISIPSSKNEPTISKLRLAPSCLRSPRERAEETGAYAPVGILLECGNLAEFHGWRFASFGVFFWDFPSSSSSSLTHRLK